MPLLAGGMAVFCCACVLSSCSPDGIHVRFAEVNVPAVSPAPTQTGAGARTSGPTGISEANIPIVRGEDNDMKDLRSCILGHWMHSHEEDAQDVVVYRPADYKFPPSRGRRGFEFREGGKLVYFGIGRADGTEQFSGSWVVESSNRIRIEVNSERIQPFVLQVVSCNDQSLEVRR